MDGPRFLRGEFRTTALPWAVAVLAERADADSSQVLMTLFARALPGDGPAVLRPMVSNRFRRGLADVVAMVAQRGILAVDVAGIPFAEALRRMDAAAMSAYKYAYCDPAATAELFAATGADPDAGLWFNDRRRAADAADADVATGDPRVPAPGVLRWTVAQDDPFDPLSVDVDDDPEVPGGLVLSVFTDTARLSAAAVEGLVRAAETAAVHEALQLLEER